MFWPSLGAFYLNVTLWLSWAYQYLTESKKIIIRKLLLAIHICFMGVKFTLLLSAVLFQWKNIRIIYRRIKSTKFYNIPFLLIFYQTVYIKMMKGSFCIRRPPCRLEFCCVAATSDTAPHWEPQKTLEYEFLHNETKHPQSAYRIILPEYLVPYWSCPDRHKLSSSKQAW